MRDEDEQGGDEAMELEEEEMGKGEMVLDEENK